MRVMATELMNVTKSANSNMFFFFLIILLACHIFLTKAKSRTTFSTRYRLQSNIINELDNLFLRR